jgi:hypothetical protein
MPALKVHVVPVWEEDLHSESSMCWCSPQLERCCPTCDADAEDCEGCWECKGAGIVDVEVFELAQVVIHRVFTKAGEGE